MKYILILMTLFSLNFASDDYGFFSKSGVKPVDNKLYQNECSACHFGYQPGLLTSKSWEIVMGNLDNHFGSDASLPKEDFDIIYKYIMENSAEKAMEYKRSRKIATSMAYASTDVDAITKTPYIIRKHREIPKKYIVQEEVKGLFNCTACHTTAQKGYYGERDIKIPNYHGRWDD